MGDGGSDADVSRSVLPAGWSSNDRYQLIHENGTVGFAFKPIGSGIKYAAGAILCFGVICPAFFIGFWMLVGRAHGALIGLIGIPTCLLGPLLGWAQWKRDVRRQKEGPLWIFETATGMFKSSRLGAAFHRDQLRAIQYLKFHRESSFVQANFVVTQPDGQLPKRYVIRTLGDWGWDNGQFVLRDFFRETGCAQVPALHHKEVCDHDLGYALVDWIKGKKK